MRPPAVLKLQVRDGSVDQREGEITLQVMCGGMTGWPLTSKLFRLYFQIKAVVHMTLTAQAPPSTTAVLHVYTGSSSPVPLKMSGGIINSLFILYKAVCFDCSTIRQCVLVFLLYNLNFFFFTNYHNRNFTTNTPLGIWVGSDQYYRR